jgi:hypothetical protein
MDDEYWATFSIYDHRTSLYRQALILFDRIVVPIPTRRVGDLTDREIEQLDKEVTALEQRGAAKRIAWDPDDFAEWKRGVEAPPAGESEAMARRLVNDPPPDTINAKATDGAIGRSALAGRRSFCHGCAGVRFAKTVRVGVERSYRISKRATRTRGAIASCSGAVSGRVIR